MLERDIEVCACIRRIGDGIQEAIGHTLGLCVHDAEAHRGQLLGQVAHKPSEVMTLVEVLAPDAGILPDEHDLARAALSEAACFGQDIR